MSDSDSAEDEMYCERHNLSEPAYKSHDPHCPYCREERKIEAYREHQITRDPQVEPW